MISEQKRASILVVEPNELQQNRFSLFFKDQEGHQCDCVQFGYEALDVLKGDVPDVFVIDLNLPDIHGLELVKAIREKSYAGIIVLSSLSDPVAKVTLLEAGADACVEKPVVLRLLLATVNQVFRRILQINEIEKLIQSADRSGASKAFSNWKLFSENWVLKSPDGIRITLTATEYKVIHKMVESGAKPVSRKELAQLLGRERCENYEDYINTLISRIRKKILSNVGSPLAIKACRGEGYVLTTQVVLV